MSKAFGSEIAKGKSFLSTRGLEKKQIEEVLSLASKMEGKQLETLKGKTVATLIYEPSTRTQFSFITAAQRLGAKTIGFSGSAGISAMKGETIHDTVKLIQACCDGIVIRNPAEGSARIAAEATHLPVINAGDGSNQHPTQAMLDLYTIRKEKKKIEGLTITMIGDLKYGRTVHSLLYALSNYDVQVELYSPPALKMPPHILEEVKGKVKVRELSEMSLGNADVVYATRIQKERFADPEEYKKYSYVIDAEKMKELKQDAILMHPLPRVNEIATEVDSDRRAKYFEQEANGIPVRMALLSMIVGE